MHESTPSGHVRCNLLPLDQQKLRHLVTNIHLLARFSAWTSCNMLFRAMSSRVGGDPVQSDMDAPASCNYR